MSNTITHEGIVEELVGDGAIVRIVQSSACSGCKIASHCVTSESKTKLISVPLVEPGRYNVGDKVMVVASDSVGVTAVIYGFVLPFIVTVGTIFAVIWTLGGDEEVKAALSGLVALALYYAVLYCFKGYFKRKITFYIA